MYFFFFPVLCGFFYQTVFEVFIYSVTYTHDRILHNVHYTHTAN